MVKGVVRLGGFAMSLFEGKKERQETMPSLYEGGVWSVVTRC